MIEISIIKHYYFDMKKYGLPYKGSKNKLAERILDIFPQKENLYDLFCGGGAISHCALLGNKFKKVYMNDINPMCTQLFVDSAKGKYHNETRWISRDDFYRLKDIDPYVAFCWSFGNNCRDYLYAQDLEPYKKAWHYALFFSDYTEAKKLLNEKIDEIDVEKDFYKKYLLSKKYVKQDSRLQNLERLQRLQNLERLQSLQNLERLQRLQSLERLERLERLETSCKSFDEVEIKPNSIIYCDIPYFNTNSYGKKNKNTFDYECFYDWCKKQKELVFISSYEMPDDFIELTMGSFSHNSTLCATANKKVVEKIFIPKHQLELYEENNTTLFV